MTMLPTAVDLSIVIVSFNTRELLSACLQSIFRETHSQTFSIEVIVVDNASTDGTQDLVEHHFSNVQLLKHEVNQGFSRANNAGVAKARGTYVLLLNSDTEVREGALESLYRSMVQKKAEIGSCQLLNPDNSIQPQGGYLPTLPRVAAWMLFIDDLPVIRTIVRPYHVEQLQFFTTDRKVGWLGGTALMVLRTLYLEMKGLDEEVFMYAEDVEFCWRAAQLDKKIWYFSEPKIVHIGHQSGSAMKARLGEIAGVIHLYKKHQSRWKVVVLRGLLVWGSFLRWFIFGIILSNAEKKHIYKTAIGVARQ